MTPVTLPGEAGRYAAVLAGLLIEARGVDVARIIATAIGEGPTAAAEIEALRDRCSQRLWPVCWDRQPRQAE